MSEPGAPGTSLKLRLYVAGNGPNSMKARNNLTQLCESEFAEGYELEVVDLLVCTHRALADGVVVTPTLLRLSPHPERRLIGNLSDRTTVLFMLKGA